MGLVEVTFVKYYVLSGYSVYCETTEDSRLKKKLHWTRLHISRETNQKFTMVITVTEEWQVVDI